MTENTSKYVLTFRQARADDLPRLLALLADDTLGKTVKASGRKIRFIVLHLNALPAMRISTCWWQNCSRK
jgi:hypothetical protein